MPNGISGLKGFQQTLTLEIVLGITLSPAGQMKVTLLKAEKSFLSIKINTPDVSTNVKELKNSDSCTRFSRTRGF